jgi:tight adherence protein B
MPTEIVMGISALGFFSVVLMFLGLDRVINGQAQAIGSRLDRYATRVVEDSKAEAQKGNRGNLFSGVNRALSKRGTNKKLTTDLARADLKLTTSEFIAINFVVVVTLGLIAFVLGRGSLIFGIVGAIIGFYAPRMYVRRLQSKRLSAFNNQLSDTLILLANSLRAGYSLMQAMETAAHELPPPMSVEFARVVREIGLGLTIQEAFTHLLERIPSEDLDFVVTAINVQHETGGNLAEILDTISHTIRERVRIKGQIQAMTATQRLSGNVVALLPIALGVFMFIFNPGYLSKMWQESCGIMMLIFGAVTITTGYFIIQKITDIEV